MVAIVKDTQKILECDNTDSDDVDKIEFRHLGHSHVNVRGS